MTVRAHVCVYAHDLMRYYTTINYSSLKTTSEILKFILFSRFAARLCRNENFDTHKKCTTRRTEKINTDEPESIAECNISHIYTYTRARTNGAVYSQAESSHTVRRLPIVCEAFSFLFCRAWCCCSGIEPKCQDAFAGKTRNVTHIDCCSH